MTASAGAGSFSSALFWRTWLSANNNCKENFKLCCPWSPLSFRFRSVSRGRDWIAHVNLTNCTMSCMKYTAESTGASWGSMMLYLHKRPNARLVCSNRRLTWRPVGICCSACRFWSTDAVLILLNFEMPTSDDTARKSCGWMIKGGGTTLRRMCPRSMLTRLTSSRSL